MMLPLKVRFGVEGLSTPKERRMRQTLAYSSASVSGVHQRGRAVPVVPLVRPLISRRCGTSRAMKASGWSR